MHTPMILGRRLPQTISPARLWSLLKSHHEIRLVDCRTPAAFANGHIPGAINEPYRTRCCIPAPRFGAKRMIVAYAHDESDYEALANSFMGAHIFLLDGGWLGWLRSGLPISPPAGSLLNPWQMVDGMDVELTSNRMRPRK